MRKVTVLAAALVVWSLGVATTQAQVRGANFGMSGCGLGSLVFPGPDDHRSRVTQVLSATTNGTFGSQTFGITTGTLNCNPEGSRSAALFIEVNREALAKDVSRGSGETIETLSAIMGCSNAAAVGAALQQSFKTIFPSQNIPNAQVTENILQTIKREKALAGTCTSLS